MLMLKRYFSVHPLPLSFPQHFLVLSLSPSVLSLPLFCPPHFSPFSPFVLSPSLSVSHRLPLLSYLFSLPPYLHQVPSQLHGGCQGRLHERESPQWHAHHHPAQKMHGANPDHLSTGQATQTGVTSADGGRRRPGQPTGWGRPSGSPVPRVRPHWLPMRFALLFIFVCLCLVSWHFPFSASCHHISNHLLYCLKAWMCACWSN